MRLLLLRHAKSAHPANIDDADRPLNEEGKQAAGLIGSFVRKHAFDPALVLCSTARRTRETLDCLLTEIDRHPQVQHEAGLYLAEVGKLLQIIHAQPSVSPLMIVGHNPGLHELGVSLLADKSTGEANRFLHKFPTAGFAAFEFDIDSWRELKPAAGRLLCYVRPKELVTSQDGT